MAACCGLHPTRWPSMARRSPSGRYHSECRPCRRWHPRQRRLRVAVERRLREELATLQVEVNEEKTRRVDLTQGESFGFLGFEFRRIRSRRGRWMPLRTPRI